MRLRHLRHLVFTLGAAVGAPLAAQDSIRTTYPAPVESRAGMVVCSSDVACDIGARILKQGGNAVDAAVATAFAMAVTYPSAGNIGGGGFMVVRGPRGVTTFDFRERAPLAATPTMYLDSAGNVVRARTARGYLAPGVPGTVRGLELAHRKHGRLPWRDVVTPAAQLAASGFAMSHTLARGLTREVARGMAPFPVSVATYGKSGGGEWYAGDTLRLPALGRSLTAIAEGGADAFYKGWIADSIAADMARNGGLITKKDLAAYRAVERAPVRGELRGYTLYSMGPPSSGGTAIVEMLNVLEQLNAGASDRWSPRTLHLVVETARRTFLDRARHLGDADFVDVPVARLTSKKYAAQVARAIDTLRATRSETLAPDLLTVAAEHEETTHISAVDAQGMTVAMTYTLEGGYGSHVVVPGAGFLLNNEMGDFNMKPGWTNTSWDIGTPANVIAPGKRMLSSMSPTIVTRGDTLVLVTGSPGGRTIISTVFGVVFNVLQYGMDARAAVDAPRMHHQWLPDTAAFEADAIPTVTADALRAMGHAVVVRGGQGDAHTIAFDPRTRSFLGANDFRSRDSKVSVP